jgi:hypothetical protein
MLCASEVLFVVGCSLSSASGRAPSYAPRLIMAAKIDVPGKHRVGSR